MRRCIPVRPCTFASGKQIGLFLEINDLIKNFHIPALHAVRIIIIPCNDAFSHLAHVRLIDRNAIAAQLICAGIFLIGHDFGNGIAQELNTIIDDLTFLISKTLVRIVGSGLS